MSDDDLSLAGNLHSDDFGFEEAIPDDASPADPRRFRRTHRGQRWYGDHLPACEFSGPMTFKARKGKEVEAPGPYYERTATGLVVVKNGEPRPLIVPSFTTISNAWPQEFYKNVRDSVGNKFRVPLDSLRTADWWLTRVMPEFREFVEWCLGNPMMLTQLGVDGVMRMLRQEAKLLGLPEEDLRALSGNFAVEDLQASADRGTDVHLILEMVALDRLDIDRLPEHIREYVPAVLEWFDKVQPEVLFAEVVGFNWDLGYACTADLVVRIGGAVHFLDGKSKGRGSDGVIGNHGVYEKYTAQVAAASRCEYFITERDGVAVRVEVPKGDFGGILSVRPDGIMHFPTDLAEGWTAMENMVHCWGQLRDGRKAARAAIMKTKDPEGKSATAHLDLDALGRGEIVLLPFTKTPAAAEPAYVEPVIEVPMAPAAGGDVAGAPVELPASERAPQTLTAAELYEIVELHPDGDQVLDAVLASEDGASAVILTPTAAAELEKIMQRPAEPTNVLDQPKAIYGPDPDPGIIKVLVTGSRDLAEEGGREAVWAALDEVHENCMCMVVVHGGCPTGADAYASGWVEHRKTNPVGQFHRVSEWVFGARWELGPSGGPLRNREMVLVARPGITLAFAAGGSLEASKGTANCVSTVRAAIQNPMVKLYENLPVDPSLRAKEKALRSASAPKPPAATIPGTQAEFNALPPIKLSELLLASEAEAEAEAEPEAPEEVSTERLPNEPFTDAPTPAPVLDGPMVEQVAAEPFTTPHEEAVIAQEEQDAFFGVPVYQSAVPAETIAKVAALAPAPTPTPTHDINPTPLDYLEPEVILEVPAGYIPDISPGAPPLADDLAVARMAKTFDAAEVLGEELEAETAYAAAFRSFAEPVAPAPVLAPQSATTPSKEDLWAYVLARLTFSIEGDGATYGGNPHYGAAFRKNWVEGEPAAGVPPQCPGIPFSMECPATYENVLTVLALVDALDGVAGVPFGQIPDPRVVPAAPPTPSAVEAEGGFVAPEEFAQLMAAYATMEQPGNEVLKRNVELLVGQAAAASPNVIPGETMRTKRRCALLAAFFLLGQHGYTDDALIRGMVRYVAGQNGVAPDLTVGALIGRLNLIGAQGLLVTIENLHAGRLEARFDADGSVVLVAVDQAVAA